MGLFKGMKDLAGVTKQARELQERQQQQAGYKPGMRGMMSQMGDMVGQMSDQVSDLAVRSTARFVRRAPPSRSIRLRDRRAA